MTETVPIPEAEVAAEWKAVLHKWARQDQYEPLFITAAEGSRFQDSNGNSYLDAFSQSWYAVAGHGEPRIADAVAAQVTTLGTVHAAGFSTAPRRQLAQKLLELLAPSFNRVFFGTNGSDAIEAALKVVRLISGKQEIIAFSGSYHGASAGAMSVTGMAECRSGFGESVPGVTFAPYPYCYRCPLGLTSPGCGTACANLVEQAILTQGPDRIAAIIGEPLEAVKGVIVPPEDYWPRVSEIARRYDIPLIFDEVVTGFGRCGSWFAYEQFGIHPDVVALGKGLTGGYQALSAAVFSDEISAAIEATPLYHGMTFEGHAVACAAALATIGVLEADDLIRRGAEMGEALGGRLRDLAGAHPCVGDVRGMGAIWGIELVRDRRTREPFGSGGPFVDGAGRPVDVAAWVKQELLRNDGVYVGVSEGIVQLAPPLAFTSADIEQVIVGLDRVLSMIDRYCSSAG